MNNGIKAKLAMFAICFLTMSCNINDSGTTSDTLNDGDVATAGEREQTSGGGPLMYLQEEVPPCTPVPGSNRDPCAVAPPPDLPSNAFSVFFVEIPQYWDLYFDPMEGPSIFTPHLIIRATFLVDTTRCGVYNRILPAFANFSLSSEARLMMCFVDARVNSYLVGTGPPILSLAVHDYFFLGDEEHDFNWLIEGERELVAQAYEGREGVLFLAPSSTTVVEAWWMTEFWDLQKETGTLNVVAPYKEDIEQMIARGFGPEDWQEEFSPERLALLEVALASFQTTIGEGAVARATETGGRIGIGDDLPMLVTDANLLRPYYEGPGVGVSYETNEPALPPPVPGGDDPVQPPGNTGEPADPDGGQTPPVPGEDTPPLTSLPEQTTSTTTTPGG